MMDAFTPATRDGFTDLLSDLEHFHGVDYVCLDPKPDQLVVQPIGDAILALHRRWLKA